MKRIWPALCLLVAACSGQPATTQTGQSPSTAATSVDSLQVKVDTKHHQCMDEVQQKPGACYLPFYTAATYEEPSKPINSAPDSKCTPADESKCWGQPTTSLTAICTTEGDLITNIKGESARTWYGVLIPEVEILIDRSALATTREGKYVGFAPMIWLSATQMGTLPNCEGLVANG